MAAGSSGPWINNKKEMKYADRRAVGAPSADPNFHNNMCLQFNKFELHSGAARCGDRRRARLADACAAADDQRARIEIFSETLRAQFLYTKWPRGRKRCCRGKKAKSRLPPPLMLLL
jgi:hypothetical protein